MTSYRWKEWQDAIENVKVFVYYGKTEMYPISEWIHPGAIPIGFGTIDDLRQDLPNLDWIIRHLAWLGFRDITIVSLSDFKGLDLFYSDFEKDLNLNFVNKDVEKYLIDTISNSDTDIIALSGLNPSNVNLRHSLLIHRQRENIASLLSIRGLKFRVGLAKIDENEKIIEFKEKPTDRSLLVNSNVLIFNSDLFYQVDKNYKEIRDKVFHDSSTTSSIISKIIELLIEQNMLSSVEVTGVSEEPWFIDLSQLETWVKLDFDEFILKFAHIYSKIES